MATSGSITTSNSSGYRNVTFQWSVKSQSIANNTTTISWSIVGAQNGADGWYYAGPFNLTIDGTKVVNNLYPSGSRIQLRAGTVVKTGETTLTHAANGTKSFSATLTAAVYDLNDMSVSGSWSLDAIPRQSSASIASSYNIGSSHSISISRASSSYYHRISYKYGSESETLISSSATTSATLNLTSWGSKIPSAMSADVTIYLRTYPTATDASNNTNQIGSTATYSTSFVIPSYSQGTPSVTRAEANTSNTTGVYVQNISKLKFTITATANYGATLSYKVVVAGQTMTSSSNVITTTSAIATSGTVGATITVTDSRGKSASTTLNTTVVAYSAPKITVAKAARSASNAAQITCTISCSVSSIKNGSTEKNSMKAYAIYDTDTSFPSPSSTYQFSTSGLSASNVSKTYTGLSTSSTYYIQLRVVDIFGYSSQIVKVGLGGILHITKNGIGVLKRMERGAFDVHGSIYSDDYIQCGESTTTGAKGVAVSNVTGSAQLHVAATGNRGIYLGANQNGSIGAHWLLFENQSGDVFIANGKTAVYTTTDQRIPGTKTFYDSYPKVMTTTAGNQPSYEFCTPNNDMAPSARIGLTTHNPNGNPVNLDLRLTSYSSSTYKNLAYYEHYRTPDVTADRTSNGDYRLLTTKSAVTIGQGGTGATSAANARANLGVNQPASLASVSIAGNATKTLSITTANYNFYLFKFTCNSRITTIFTTYSQLSTSAQTYRIDDGTSTGATVIITRTASGITVKRDGSTACSVVLTYWN